MANEVEQYARGREIGFAICAAIPNLSEDMRRGIADSIHGGSRDALIGRLMQENVELQKVIQELCRSISSTLLDSAERAAAIGAASYNANVKIVPG